MTDTDPRVAQMVADHDRAMTPSERCLEASLPAGLTERERRFVVARRLYGRELPEAALAAYAEFG
jgi:hypothetical protein